MKANAERATDDFLFFLGLGMTVTIN